MISVDRLEHIQPFAPKRKKKYELHKPNLLNTEITVDFDCLR